MARWTEDDTKAYFKEQTQRDADIAGSRAAQEGTERCECGHMRKDHNVSGCLVPVSRDDFCFCFGFSKPEVTFFVDGQGEVSHE